MCDATRALHQQMFLRLHSNYKTSFFLFLFPEKKIEKKDEEWEFLFRLSYRFFKVYYHREKILRNEIQVQGNTRPNKYFFDFRVKSIRNRKYSEMWNGRLGLKK